MRRYELWVNRPDGTIERLYTYRFLFQAELMSTFLRILDFNGDFFYYLKTMESTR